LLVTGHISYVLSATPIEPRRGLSVPAWRAQYKPKSGNSSTRTPGPGVRTWWWRRGYRSRQGQEEGGPVGGPVGVLRRPHHLRRCDQFRSWMIARMRSAARTVPAADGSARPGP